MYKLYTSGLKYMRHVLNKAFLNQILGLSNHVIRKSNIFDV